MKIKINKAVVIIICVFLLHGDNDKENSRMAVFILQINNLTKHLHTII